jgi:hypothetical protein
MKTLTTVLRRFPLAAAALATALCGITVPVTTTPQPDNSGRLADRQFLVRTSLGSGYARYFGTGSLDGNRTVTRALIVVHGVLRDADYYYDTGVIAADAAHALNETLVSEHARDRRCGTFRRWSNRPALRGRWKGASARRRTFADTAHRFESIVVLLLYELATEPASRL